MNRIPGMTQQLAGVAVPGQPQTYNPYGQVQPVMTPNPYITPAMPQQQIFNPYNPTPGGAVPTMAQPGFNSSVAPNPYAPVAPYTPGVTPYAPQPTVAQPTYAVPGVQPAYNPYAPATQIPGVGLPQHQPAVAPYNPYAPTTQPAYNPYAPTIPGVPQAYGQTTPMQPVTTPYVEPQHLGIPTYPYTAVQPQQTYDPYVLQSQSNYSQNGIPSESEHIYNSLYSSSKTKKEIVDYIKERNPSYSSQESGGITTYFTIFGIYFVCDDTITNSNFLEAVLKSALIKNYRIFDNGYVAFISEIAISCSELNLKDQIISFAKDLCEKNYLLTLRKEQFIFTNLGTLLFLDFSNLIPKEYIMGLEKDLISPTGAVLYQDPSLLFNNVDCLFIDILEKKCFKRNEIIEIEKRITNFNQLKRSVCR